MIDFIDESGLRGGLRPNPSITELTCLIEATNRSSERNAARALGMDPITLHSHLFRLHRRIGARTRAQAVALLWPIVGSHLLLEHPRLPRADRRLGIERRAA